MKIIQPTVILDSKICRSNIHRMAEKARQNELTFRPHFKTHQSAAISEWFRNEGVNKIATSSLAMAEYFADAGWTDITVAFPVNVLEIDRINRLAEKITLNLLLVHAEALNLLLEDLKHAVGIFIKIDVGTHRTGIMPDHEEDMEAIFELIQSSSLLNFKGFLGHAGHTYRVRGKTAVQKIHEESTAILKQLKQKYKSRFPNLIISTGDTPSCSLAEGWESIDEIRPGNFVFYDLVQAQIGSCGINDIAVALACPIVAKHKERTELIIYGGGIHLSKDRLQSLEGIVKYGQVVLLKEDSWEFPKGDNYVKGISQEHGVVKCTEELFEKLKVGQVIGIIPVHSCMNVDLAGHYLTFDNQKLPKFSFGK